MIDAALTRIARWIQSSVIPEFKYFFEIVTNIKLFDNMSPEELQLACIKLALEALLLIVLLKIGRAIAKRVNKKQRRKAKSRPQTASKKFQPKTWSPTDWYWDEEKGEWVAPDYINTEARTRWKWDEAKQIWIDLEKK